MESQLKCSLKDHSKVDAIKYCKKCEVYMCNKCIETHKNFLPNHQTIDIGKEDTFSELCREEKHNQVLEYFCKSHNKLCCALCITKIKDKGKGQHKDCDICVIEDIKSQKLSQLKQNISKLEQLSKEFQTIKNESKVKFEKIDENKGNLKMKIQKIFTTLRNALNDREDELLSQVDNNFNLFFKGDITKESEKLLVKINNYLEKGKLAEKEWEYKNKLNFAINESIIIENNMKEINIEYEKIKDIICNDILDYKFSPDNFELGKIIVKIKNFGEIQKIEKNKTEVSLNKESKIEEILKPEENFLAFIEKFKAQLKNEKKIGDKNEIDIEIRGTTEESKGVSIDLFTIDQKLFKEYFGQRGEHLQSALFAFTLNLELKNEEDLNSVMKDFETLKNIAIEMPIYKKNSDKYDIIFRNNGKKFAIDFISRQGKMLQLLLELYINLSEYFKFHFNIKTEIDFNHLFKNSSDDYISKLLNIFISTKLSGKNLKYLLKSTVSALKTLKLKNEGFKNKLIQLIYLITFLIGINLKLEYDIANIEYKDDSINIVKGYINMASSLSQNLIRPFINGTGLSKLITLINLDSFSFSFGIPKYENGLTIVIKLPGISQYFDDLFK